jgi:hypothetical protein
MSLRRLLPFSIVTVVTCLVALPALAVKPGQEVNPNGFPGGEHYTLNIHGKKIDFQCPEPEFDENGNPVYGGSIFIPEDGQGIQIIMESGSSKGKHAATITDFGVKDPCTADFDGDAAVLQLPPNDKGYRVYGRPLAKPTDEPSLQVMPELLAAVDEFGNDLIFLGLVTDKGFESSSEIFTRKKGKSKAVDITGLFQWSGDVCYFSTALCDPIEECTQRGMSATSARPSAIPSRSAPRAPSAARMRISTACTRAANPRSTGCASWGLQRTRSVRASPPNGCSASPTSCAISGMPRTAALSSSTCASTRTSSPARWLAGPSVLRHHRPPRVRSGPLHAAFLVVEASSSATC